jgi:malonate decarboxylase beta subunit
MSSYQEANARERLRLLLDAGSFEEFVGPGPVERPRRL